jgi:hypothetical protein
VVYSLKDRGNAPSEANGTDNPRLGRRDHGEGADTCTFVNQLLTHETLFLALSISALGTLVVILRKDTAGPQNLYTSSSRRKDHLTHWRRYRSNTERP